MGEKRFVSDLYWWKRKGTTGKIEPSPQFLAEEKFIFQRTISTAISSHIPNFLVLNIDQTPLPYVSSGQYTFSFKRSKNVPIKGPKDDKGPQGR